ncbi:MAG TPA: TolC family protein [Candidatus Dormibacteraeota bacterium]|nr:TolC family protein [Candidatus Dormibacteraeota bacterium]
MTLLQNQSFAAKIARSHIGQRSMDGIFILVLLASSASGFAQATLTAQGGAPLTITLQDALQRARLNDPQYRSAVTDLGLAREDRVQARAGLLPSVNYNNSFIYTEGTGQPASCGNSPAGCPKYIANNGVHEYLSQADVHQSLSLTSFADYRRSAAALAQARAKAEIATRGLVVTVTQGYYGLVVAQRKYANAQRAAAEADRFLDISLKLEKGGEVAHADAIKARIQAQQQQRDLQEAQLDMERSRLDLAVLLFPDFNQDYAVVDDLQMPEPLPTFEEVEAAGKKNNPELRASLAAYDAANHEVTAAWGGLLPALSLDYFYGIDSNKFAIRTDGVRNLGYSAVATLQIPIFSWGSDRSKLKQAELRRDQARVELTHAQRQLLSHLRQFYLEAKTSRSEMESLASSAEMAAESMRLTTLRYQAGESTVLEVVDAQNTLTQARNAYDDGQSRYRVAVANLQTLTGNF